jgi:hypothetical protein
VSLRQLQTHTTYLGVERSLQGKSEVAYHLFYETAAPDFKNLIS